MKKPVSGARGDSDVLIFPCNFLLFREFLVQTSSHQTASTAIKNR